MKMAPSSAFVTPSSKNVVDARPDDPPSGSGLWKTGSMFERRRRRMNKVDNNRNDPSTQKGPTSTTDNSRQKRREMQKQRQAEDDVDPYDSDPGESYREHCQKAQGFSTKSCLAMPKFLNKSAVREEQSVLTAPPSPLQSEMGDLSQMPASLPANLTRVRYSLRSSITDGAEPQPLGPTVMERRDLRPNNVKMNVSHWSDEGGRPYMEDR